MKGLEAAIVSHSTLPTIERMDAQFFKKETVEAVLRLEKLGSEALGTYLMVNTRGKQPLYGDEGLPVVNSKHVRGMTVQITEENRTALASNGSVIINTGDILLNGTGVGTICRTSLFTDIRPALPDNHVTVLRTKGIEREYLLAFLNCRFGQLQLEQHIRGSSGQIELYPPDIARVLVPKSSPEFRLQIVRYVDSAMALRTRGLAEISSAEICLLNFLGLADWIPPEPLTYTASASDAFAAGRLDARFFAPRNRALLVTLSKGKRTVADVARQRRQKFRPDADVNFDYIEISDLDGAGAATSTHLTCAEAPSRATWHVRPDDIITSTVRPIRRLSAQIAPEQDGFVCSSGFVVVEPRAIASEVLLTYLRLPVICELLDLSASASMYPAITENDIFNLPLPHIPDRVSAEITRSVRNARAAKTRAAAMLDAAKRAVEIAIENNEAAAMAYLAQAEDAV